MRIRTQFIITMLLFGIILVVMAASAIITDQRLEKASKQERLSAEIAEGASELSYLTDEYLIYRESRQVKRWQSRFASFSEQAANLSVDIPQQQALVRNIRGNQTRLKEVFDSVVSALEGPSRSQSSGLDPALLQISWSRMAVQGRELVADASRLSQLLHQEMDQLTAATNQLLYVMLALFGVFLLFSYMLTYRRILKSIAKLQTDTKIIGAGNLEFKTEEKKNDEIGDLARAFNRMTVNLKTVTASKADLEREIADRKQAEEALRESEAKYRNLFENMAEEVHFWQVVRDEAGRIKTWRLVDVNPPTLKTWGRSSADEIRGKTTDEIFGPGATDHYMPVVQKIMTEGVPYSFEDYFPNLDKYFRFTSVPLGDYFITTGADITDIKKAYEALRESEERWAVTLGSIGDAVIATDTNGRVTFLNPVAETLTGWSLAEAAGRPVQEVFRIVNEHTRAVVDDPVSKVLQTGLIVGLANHTVLLRKGGGEIPIDDSGAPIRDAEGRVFGVVLIFRDITERKQAEQKLAWLASFPGLNPNPIAEIELANGEVRFANATAERLFPDLIRRGVAHPFLASAWEMVDARRANAEPLVREVAVGDAWYLESLSLAPDQQRLRIYGMDITERKQAEEAVSRSQKTFAELVERSPFGTYIVDSQFRIAMMNAASQDGAFRNVRPVIGRDFAEAMRILWPEPVAAEIIGHFRHTLDTGEPYYSRDFINPRHDVEIVEAYEWELHRMTLPDGQHGVICYYYDSTKLREAEAAVRESEAKFRLALKNSPVLVAMQDTNLVYKWAYNTRTRRAEDVIGKTDAELFAPEDLPAILEVKRKVLQTGREIRLGDWLTSSGQRVFLDCCYEPIRDHAGQIIGVGIAAVNLTEQKQAEEALRQLNETLEQRVAERTELAEKRTRQLQALAMELIEAEERERQRVAELLHDDLQQSLAAARMQLQAACDCPPADTDVLANIEKILNESLNKARRLSHELSPAVLHHSGLVASLEWLARQMKEQFGLQRPVGIGRGTAV